MRAGGAVTGAPAGSRREPQQRFPWRRALRDSPLLAAYLSLVIRSSQAVTVVPYRPAWAEIAAAEIARLRAAVGEPALGIEHVGSTAVAGLAAKPVVDLVLGLADDEPDPATMRALRRLGYVARRRSGTGRVNYRRGSPRTTSVHVVRFGGAEWHAYLRLRDLLRADAEAAARYGALKLRLARSGADPATYAAGKAVLLETLGVRAHRQ